MRIVLGIFETVLYLMALLGFVVGIVITIAFSTSKAGDDAVLRGIGFVAGLYTAVPAFTLGCVALTGGALLTVVDRRSREG